MSESLNPVSDETLTAKEADLLQLLADGKKLEEASEEMGWREQTGKNYLVIIRMKLDAQTTFNAIAIALRRSIID